MLYLFIYVVCDFFGLILGVPKISKSIFWILRLTLLSLLIAVYNPRPQLREFEVLSEITGSRFVRSQKFPELRDLRAFVSLLLIVPIALLSITSCNTIESLIAG
jgi:hypothetical protein